MLRTIAMKVEMKQDKFKLNLKHAIAAPRDNSRCKDASPYTSSDQALFPQSRRPRGAKKKTDRWDRHRSPHVK